MTFYELKNQIEKHNPGTHYFDRDTLRFFGERLSEMYVLKNTVVVRDYYGHFHTCYVLSKYSRNYPGGPRRTYAYFGVETFKAVRPFKD